MLLERNQQLIYALEEAAARFFIVSGKTGVVFLQGLLADVDILLFFRLLRLVSTTFGSVEQFFQFADACFPCRSFRRWQRLK